MCPIGFISKYYLLALQPLGNETHLLIQYVLLWILEIEKYTRDKACLVLILRTKNSEGV